MDKLFIPKYCDSGSILLINSTGALRKLYCPFRVRVIESVYDFRAGIYVWVEEVGSNSNDILTYSIFDKSYNYYYFKIEVNF